MTLTLEVVGPHAASMGSNVRRVLGEAELKIGRDSDNDWILPQSYVSRHQAVVRCVNGMYFLEQIGSCPIVLNETGRPLERNRIARLSAGDRILLDDIEIRVLADEQPRPNPVGMTSPMFTDAGPVPVAPLEPMAPLDAFDAPQAGGTVDPLELLGLHPQAHAAVPAGPRMPEIGSLLDEAMTPRAAPGPLPPRDAPRRPMLSDNWFNGPAVSQRPAPAPPAAPPPAAWAAEPIAPPPPRERAAIPSPGAGRPAGLREAVAAPMAAAPAAAGTIESLLRGAGIDPAHAQVSEEVAAQLGEVLRIVVEGTMQVLQARNQIRREFRMVSTQVAPKNNNPLKFSADVADALHKLLVQRSPAYLDTVSAFSDAFDDIRVHQLAMLGGLRVAFDAMLRQFDPAVLEAQFAKQAGRGSLLGLGGKPKPWESYEARYAELMADRDFAFRRLFGEEFGKAYEQNLEQQRRMLKAGKNGA